MLQENGYQGRIAPINPKETEIMGLESFARLDDVPFEIDLALICTPARTAPEIIRQCGARSIPGAIILAGGFSESGPEGAALERETVAAARAAKVRIVGPNTAGMFDAHTGCFLMGINGVEKGAMGVLSQSGNVLVSLVAKSFHQGASGFSTFVGLGNEADIQYHEYVDFFAADPRTGVLAIYLEGLRNGTAFLASARAMSAEKPIVVYKAGRTAAGESAARSHSGSLAGDYAVAKGVLRQAGVTVVERSDELFPVADMLSKYDGKPARRVAVLSEGGGPISQAVDALSEYGLEMPELDVATIEGLKTITPAASQLSNPIDAGGGTDPHPRYYVPCASEILADENIDALLIVGYFGAFQLRWKELAGIENEAAAAMVALKEKTGKPIVVQCHYADFDSEGIGILRAGGIPVITSIEVASRSLAALADRSSRGGVAVAVQDAPHANAAAAEIIRAVRAKGHSGLLETEALNLLKAHGIETPPFALLAEGEDAGRLAPGLGDVPVALKVVSHDIIHKTEVGGVMLNRKGPHDIGQGMDELLDRVRAHKPDAAIEGVLVAPMATGGVEIILGLTRDPHFGPIIVFGLGGTAVEVYRDIAFAALPVSRDDALNLIDSIKGKAILEGARGVQPVSKAHIADLIVKFAALAQAHPEICEIDLNPVLANAKGCTILDARILLED